MSVQGKEDLVLSESNGGSSAPILKFIVEKPDSGIEDLTNHIVKTIVLNKIRIVHPNMVLFCLILDFDIINS